jgi:hypothetical protein
MTSASIVNFIEYGLPMSVVTSESNRRTPIDGQAKAEGAADRREQETFHEQLANDAPAAGTERDAHRNFTTPLGGSRQQQVRDIRTRDEQNERHRAHEGEENQADRTSRDALVVGHHPRTEILVRVGKVLRQLRADALDLAARLRQRHSWREPAHRLQRAHARFVPLTQRVASTPAPAPAAARTAARRRCSAAP